MICSNSLPVWCSSGSQHCYRGFSIHREYCHCGLFVGAGWWSSTALSATRPGGDWLGTQQDWGLKTETLLCEKSKASNSLIWSNWSFWLCLWDFEPFWIVGCTNLGDSLEVTACGRSFHFPIFTVLHPQGPQVRVNTLTNLNWRNLENVQHVLRRRSPSHAMVGWLKLQFTNPVTQPSRQRRRCKRATRQ